RRVPSLDCQLIVCRRSAPLGAHRVRVLQRRGRQPRKRICNYVFLGKIVVDCSNLADFGFKGDHSFINIEEVWILNAFLDGWHITDSLCRFNKSHVALAGRNQFYIEDANGSYFTNLSCATGTKAAGWALHVKGNKHSAGCYFEAIDLEGDSGGCLKIE